MDVVHSKRVFFNVFIDFQNFFMRQFKNMEILSPLPNKNKHTKSVEANKFREGLAKIRDN